MLARHAGVADNEDGTALAAVASVGRHGRRRECGLLGYFTTRRFIDGGPFYVASWKRVYICLY